MAPAVYRYGTLEHLRQHFTADVLLTRFRIGKHAARRRDDDRAKAVADARKVRRTRIDAAAGLRHARQMVDCRLAFEIFELDAQATLAGKLFFRIAADVAFALKHVEDAG